MTLLNQLKKQLQQNLLALISLIIAITALSYNSWRNERSEANRNYRAAGFEIMRETAQLQLLIDTTTYSNSVQDADAIKGWVSINLILSLSELMPPEVKNKANELKSVWTENWSALFESKQANQEVSNANLNMVTSVKQELIKLN